MALSDLATLPTYRSLENNIVEEFLIPALKQSKRYQRAVGYFTIGGFMTLAPGLAELIEHGGSIEVIASPEMNSEDVEILSKGYCSPSEWCKESLAKALRDVDGKHEILIMDVIANLLNSELLTFKIAFTFTGMYHEKIGIIHSASNENDYIAFSGSLNETASAMHRNVESINVFPSWVHGAKTYAESVWANFLSVWENRSKDLCVLDLPVAIRQDLIAKYKESPNHSEALRKLKDYLESIKPQRPTAERSPHEYQKKAIAEFFQNDCRHFYQMATGTGKTYTAIMTLKKFLETRSCLIFILVPQIDLQHQWLAELKREGFSDIHLIGGDIGVPDVEQEVNDSLIDFRFTNVSHVFLCVYDTFFMKAVSILKKRTDLFFIVDEAHNLSPAQFSALPKDAKYRLGLSATPTRYSSEETNDILDFFLSKDKKPYLYGIKEAIETGFLAHYNYYPLLVDLDDDEFDKYASYSQKIAAAESIKPRNADLIGQLLNARSLIVKKAAGKMVLLRNLVEDPNYSFRRAVVYCGQGKSGEGERRMIDDVVAILSEKERYIVAKFTSDTENRSAVLRWFKAGFYNTLAAIRCFDEGIDVPELERLYIMASDRGERQTIQRRGRVLRRCKESGKDVALIYDMVCLPPLEKMGVKSALNLIAGEMTRVRTYNELANNRGDNEGLLAQYEIPQIEEVDESESEEDTW